MSEILVNIPNLPGEATKIGYEGQIVCIGMQYGIDLPVTPVGGGYDRVDGVALHSPIILTHAVDKASPLLRYRAAYGSSLGTVTITRFKTEGGQSTVAEVITLGSATVEQVGIATPTGNDGFAEQPLEEFMLGFDEIKWDVKYLGQANERTFSPEAQRVEVTI